MRSIAVAAIAASLMSVACSPVWAQTAPAKPKSPAAIAEASQEMAEKNNWCRTQAKDQKLKGKNRRAFIRDCKKQP
jgi:hypothetical protein